MRSKTILVSVFFLLFLSPLVFAQTVPSLPAVYYGNITTACNLEGSEIRAYMDSELRGQLIIHCLSSNFCYYGGPKLSDDKLIIQGNSSDDGKLIVFYVYSNGNTIEIGRDNYTSGQIKSLNFEVTQEQCNNLLGAQPSGGGVIPEETSEEETSEGAVSGAAGGVPFGVSETAIQKLEEEGIKEIIEEYVSLENISNVEVEQSTTFEFEVKEEELATRSDIENIVSKIEGKIEEQVNKNVRVKPSTIKVRVSVKVIKIKTKSGEEKYFTKIEKEIEKDRVIEVVPKDLAEKASDVEWVRGVVLGVIEEDPVFEVKPEGNKIEYMVEGNKTEEVKDIVTVTYTYEIVEFHPGENITKLSENITQPQQNATIQETERNEMKVWIPIGLVMGIITAILAYLIIKRKITQAK